MLTPHEYLRNMMQPVFATLIKTMNDYEIYRVSLMFSIYDYDRVLS